MLCCSSSFLFFSIYYFLLENNTTAAHTNTASLSLSPLIPISNVLGNPFSGIFLTDCCLSVKHLVVRWHRLLLHVEDEAKTFLECVANTPVDELHKNDIDESIHKFYRKCTKAAEVGCRLHFEETVGRNSNSIGNSSQTLGINNINIDKMADLKCW